MEAILSSAVGNVILGVIGNGLTSLIGYAGKRGEDFLIGKELLQKIELDKTSLEPVLSKVTEAAIQVVQSIDGIRLEEICLFLGSPEVEGLIRQIFSAKLIEKLYTNNIELVQQEFIYYFTSYFVVSDNLDTSNIKSLFEKILLVCESTLNEFVNQGRLSAHESKSMLRHHILLSEIANIKKNLSLMLAESVVDLKAVLEFELKYRQQVSDRHAYITPPNFDISRRIPLENLYVTPDFIFDKGRSPQEQAIPFELFLSSIHRSVVLGSPGGGKSTLTAKICRELGVSYSGRPVSNKRLTPILVVLREYGAEKKERGTSILQFIESQSNKRYQLLPPKNAFEYLLLSTRVLVIFDGLDELLDTSHRQEIIGDVESFCNLYPSAPVLITSREVGYDQARVNERRFEVFRLAPFSDEKVNEYVKKWYYNESDLDEDARSSMIKAVISESEVVPDLRVNPLMLALMCNVYRGEGYIPQNRPDVYEKCATMLFDRWDRSRGIYAPPLSDAHIRPAMMYLAHWIYTSGDLRNGVTEEGLIKQATTYLYPKRFEDEYEAEKAARDFVKFCRGRAWVFTDTGTTRSGEPLYQFTHTTFLEYFTAAHICRMNSTPDKLATILFPRIAKKEWDVVAQLAFQIQSKNLEDAGDDLLAYLLTNLKPKDVNEQGNVLLFAVRCLQFMSPSPIMVREIITIGFNYIVNYLLRFSGESRKSVRGESIVPTMIRNLLLVSKDNRKITTNTLENILVSMINSSNNTSNLVAAELMIRTVSPRELSSSYYSEEIVKYWDEFSNRLVLSHIELLNEISRRNMYLYIILNKDKTNFNDGISDILSIFSINDIFTSSSSNVFSFGYIPYVIIYLRNFLETEKSVEHSSNYDQYENDFSTLGKIAMSETLPWINEWNDNSDTLLFIYHHGYHHLENELTDIPNPDASFGIFCVLASFFEGYVTSTSSSRQKNQISLFFNKVSRPIIDNYRNILSSRYIESSYNHVVFEMSNFRFSDEQKAFILRWINKNISFRAKRRSSTKG